MTGIPAPYPYEQGDGAMLWLLGDLNSIRGAGEPVLQAHLLAGLRAGARNRCW